MMRNTGRSDTATVLRSPGDERLLGLEPFSAGMVVVVVSKRDGKSSFFPTTLYTLTDRRVYFYSHIKGLPVGNPSEPAGKRYFQNKFVFIFHYLVNKTKYMFLSEVLYFCLDVCNF